MVVDAISAGPATTGDCQEGEESRLFGSLVRLFFFLYLYYFTNKSAFLMPPLLSPVKTFNPPLLAQPAIDHVLFLHHTSHVNAYQFNQ